MFTFSVGLMDCLLVMMKTEKRVKSGLRISPFISLQNKSCRIVVLIDSIRWCVAESLREHLVNVENGDEIYAIVVARRMNMNL